MIPISKKAALADTKERPSAKSPATIQCGLIAAAVLSIRVAVLAAEGLENGIPSIQKPMLQVFPPPAAEQSKAGTGKFVIFTREQIGTNWDFIAGAWECIPSRPKMPVTKRAEFCHSSWKGTPFYGMHPRFVRLQVDDGVEGYTVNLYDINYRTWRVQCLWQGRQLIAFGVIGNSIFCNSGDGWLLLDAVSGKISKDVPFTPIETDGNYWLVRKIGEINGCWSYDRVKRQFIAHFGSVDSRAVGYYRSLLSPDGRSRAWILAPMPAGWHSGVITGKLILQRDGKRDISTTIEMQAVMGSGVPVIPHDIRLEFSSEGLLQFRARKGENEAEDRVWSIEVATGHTNSAVAPHLPAEEASGVLDGVAVPDYLRTYVKGLEHFGASALAPAFFLHMGILEERPEYPDCIAGVSPDGRHVLYRAKKGSLAGIFIYGDLLTKQIVRWESPDGLDCREAQEFVWVETPH